ncbi:STAS domain-containing protein [Paenibacillus sp. Soil724D2]|uniref:STAS domain-containing protein n=1 Tax=Paenibacillus sp. (strain Soil724D2) TaxID=1736392 RepID=UPI0007137225|nr:STAS domain-containing protein [Paenibacillus sp. Soil724D2]KRE48379.1 hypothetical protein ASG85_05090 [Paenibacillus sp. Soil724D2]
MNLVKLTDKYSFHNFQQVCESIKTKIEAITRTKSMILDLSEVTFVDPFGMVTILGLCRHMFNTYGVCTNIVLPEGDAGAYMERAGFARIIPQDHFITVQKRKNIRDYFKRNQNMGVLRFFNSEKDIQPINAEVEGWMESNSFSEEDKNSIAIFISEMVQNVVQHSNTPQPGVLCIQSYTNKKGEPFLSWAIGDSGIGIRQSLVDAGVNDMNGMEDSRVIREVILKGISRFQDDITRGNGLSRLYKAAQKRSAILFIHSHSGIFGLNITQDKQKKVENDIPLVAGTNIGFYIRS